LNSRVRRSPIENVNPLKAGFSFWKAMGKHAEAVAARPIREAVVARALPDPWAKYRQQQAGAAKRGIEWRLTFGEWWSLWEPHYANRGRKKTQLVMCRTLDSGPYELGNVRIDLACNNGHERKMSRFAKWGCRYTHNRRALRHLAEWHTQEIQD
jgi:hypothetical protein